MVPSSSSATDQSAAAPLPVVATVHGARVLDRSRAQPLWLQLQTDIRRRIDDHDFVDEFPGEYSLTKQYQVSRQTVRAALRGLREDGVITAERGLPPRVARPIYQPLGTLYSLFASVEATGITQRSVVLTLDVRTDPFVSGRLNLAADDELVYLERLRFADDEPLAVDQAWLPASLARPLLDADFTHTALYDEMAQRCGLQPGGGEEHIDAVNLTASQATQLAAPSGVAAFSVTRLGCAAGRPVEWRHTLIRADRFRLVAQFSPSTGFQLQVTTPAQRPHLSPQLT